MTVLKGALIAVAISCMGLFSGIIFGWGTLQLILEEEGLYSSGCTEDDDICPSRQNKFFLLYTISTSTFLVASFFSGMAVDKYGPTKVAIFNGIAFVTALLLLGLSDTSAELCFLAAGMLLGCGGAVSLNNSFPLSFVVDPGHIPLVMTAVNCLFDASSVIFLFCYLIYRHTVATRRSIFTGFAVLAFLLYIALVFLWHHIEPEFNKRKQDASKFDENNHGAVDEAAPVPEEAKSAEVAQGQALVVAGDAAGTGLDNVTPFDIEADVPIAEQSPTRSENTEGERKQPLGRPTLKPQLSVKKLHAGKWTDELRKEPFVFILIFGSLSMLRTTAVFGLVVDVLVSLGDDKTGFLYTQLFFIIQPMSFLAVPLINYLMSHHGFMISFRVLLFMGALYAAILMIPVLPIQIISFVVFSCYRSLLYSVMGTYMVQLFGPLNCGRFYGTLNILSGVVNLLQYPALYLTSSVGNGNYYYLLGALLAIVFPLWLLAETMLRDILHQYPDADCKKGTHHLQIPTN